MIMQINALSQLTSIQGEKTSQAKPTSDQTFVADFLSVVNAAKPSAIPAVGAKARKEFDFWTEEEDSDFEKPFKLRTKDDVLAEIEKLIRDPKQEK